jgi:multiple sugar transport system ATP-binding protein
VDVVEYLGADSFVVAECGPLGRITARVRGDTGLRPGDPVGLVFEEDWLSFFDADGRAIPD